MEQIVTKKKLRNKKKTINDYENISSKLIEFHNTETVSFVKSLNKYGPIKLSRIRCLKLRDDLETGKYDSNYCHAFTIEYLTMNKFILELLPENERKSCLELMNTFDIGNKIIAANMLYTLIEDKKKEIIEKLNGK